MLKISAKIISWELGKLDFCRDQGLAYLIEHTRKPIV